MYLLYKGFGLDEFIHGIINALRASMSRGKFSFVTYSTTIVLVLIGFTIGIFTVLNYYSSDDSMGILLYVMSFIYGAILVADNCRPYHIGRGYYRCVFQ